MSLNKVYVSIVHRKVYIYPDESPWEYEVNANREIIPVFEKLFNQLSSAETSNFWRAHIPIRYYHLDEENDEYDTKLKKLYALIHEFSNEESRSLIEKLPYFNESRRVFVE
ncbi:transposase [Psychrobacillus glaciei]|uniref:Transposase n=1 Tax=Psychrobacillus glaciei TaxID=2283160 RepID=A0A5J6SPB8_9BACI|nr:transposase [Psychrobacillus glaciei]QFF99775.1 transposase [Psychrobacillus glaciei]